MGRGKGMKKKLVLLLCVCVFGSMSTITGCSEKKEAKKEETEQKKELKKIGEEKGRMKKLVALGLAISMSCNGSLLIANAEDFSQNVINVAENQVEQNANENKNDILISSDKIEIQVEQKAYFYMVPKLENFIASPVITLSDSSLAQVSEVALEQVHEENDGRGLLENAPSNAKWYEVTANAAGNVIVIVEYEGVQKEIEILIHGTEIDESAAENIVELPQTDADNASTSISNEDGAEENLEDENVTNENETILSQRISDGWSQDGLYYYIDGEMVKGIAEIKGVLYYFDAGTGRLCKKAQWIEQDGKRYFCNAEGILYRNQFIKFGTIYYYMGNDGSMQTGIVKANDGRLYYIGEDGTVQKKAQWIEQDGKRYFCNAEGVLYKNQFIKFGTIYYYMGSDGSMQTGIVKANDGRLYYIGEDGTVQKKAQWIEQDGKRYFCNAQGIIYQNQVITFGNIWYCMGEDGSVQYGIAKAGGKYYNTDKVTGIVIKKAGWIEANGKRYFSKADGNLYQNQFIKFGETYYYCGRDAAIIKSTTQAVNGVLYRFDSNGIMIKEGGWGEYKGNKYYKNPITGFPYKNQWVTFGRTWYYANANGFMVSGWQTIGGYKYYFYSDTKYMARNTVIDGIRIGDDGRVVAYGTRMSSFTTVSTNNANGTYNMSKALKSFNQVVIQPGQTISFFDIAGPCGKAEGYLPAGVVGGIGYGGGICQASTTLYGAALRAGLTIVERRNHSVPSTYVPIGQDAMVNYGSSDLKIRNDFNFPVKLVTYTKGKTLYAEVWGTQPSWYDYISIESWWSGSRSAVAYRKYIKNGQVVKTEQLPSSYY